MDDLGRLIPRNKIRGKKRVIEEIEKRMEEFADDGLDYADKCYISNSACSDDARAVADIIECRFPSSKARWKFTASAPRSAAIPAPAPSPCSSGVKRTR
ncbi:MAG: hypothetical protein ACLRSW_09910 [Christensenellaceae bacterium]